MIAPGRAPRQFGLPSNALLALLLVLPAIPVFAVLAATRPVDALAIAILAVVTVALLSDLTLGVCIFVAAQFALPIFPVGALAKFFGLALVVRWLIEIALPNPSRPLKSFARRYPAMTVFLVASLVYSTVTALWAPAPATVIETVERYALNAVLLATVFAASRSRDALHWIAAAIACGGALTVAALLITGTDVDTSRLTDSAVDANELAMTLIASIFFGCLLAVQAHSVIARLFFAGVAGLSFYGLMLTNSRGGLTALVSALLVLVIFGGRWRAKLAFIAAVALVSMTTYLVVFAPAEQRDRVAVVLGVGDKPVDRSGTGRTSVWVVGLRAFKDRPLEGFGYGNFREVTPHYLLAEPGLVRESRFILKPLVAHNTFLQSLVEVGIIGSLLFFVPVVGALVAFVAAARRFQRMGNLELELYARVGFAALVGVLIASFFISEGLAKIWWILIGLGFALFDLYRPQGLRPDAAE
jgi:O-antigen ligase